MRTPVPRQSEWGTFKMATVDFSKEADEEKVYPAVHHFKIIVDIALFNEDILKRELAAYDLRSPLVRGRASSGGKYVTYEVSVYFETRMWHHQFDGAVKAVPGVKILL